MMANRIMFTAMAVGVALATAQPATAQSINADPTYETVRLDSGFTPDPYFVRLQSGGGIDASTIGSNCRGYIADAPDVRLFFDAGRLPLIISSLSDSDTTLVINAPNGRWYCDDDSGGGLNPSITFDPPLDGRYEIWVGTYGSRSLAAARLAISELYSE